MTPPSTPELTYLPLQEKGHHQALSGRREEKRRRNGRSRAVKDGRRGEWAGVSSVHPSGSLPGIFCVKEQPLPSRGLARGLRSHK